MANKRPIQNVIEAGFDVFFVIGDDARIAALTAGGGNGQDRTDRKMTGRSSLMKIEVKGIAFIEIANRNTLGDIQNAAPANSEDHLDLGAFGEHQSSGDERLVRIGGNPREFDVGDAFLIQEGNDFVIETDFLDRAAPVNQQNRSEPIAFEIVPIFSSAPWPKMMRVGITKSKSFISFSPLWKARPTTGRR
jgi:hypothetical protein